VNFENSGAFDSYPPDFPRIWFPPSSISSMEAEKARQKGIRKFSERWQIKEWIKLNSHFHVTLKDWLGYDPFQDWYGLDRVVSEAIHYALEDIAMERKHQDFGAKQSSKALESPELRFPKNLRTQ